MQEKDKHYFPYFSGKGNVKDIGRIDKFYNFLKDRFFDSYSYKWKISYYKSYVKKYNLDYNICCEAISNVKLGNAYANKKGFYEFQKNIVKYNSIVNTKEKILIKEGKGKDFIRDFIQLRESYFKTTNKEFIKIIDANFDTGMTKKTIESYYKDFTPKK